MWDLLPLTLIAHAVDIALQTITSRHFTISENYARDFSAPNIKTYVKTPLDRKNQPQPHRTNDKKGRKAHNVPTMAPLINNILHHLLARQTTEPSSENDAFADFEFYRYSPSLAAAIIFALLFIASTALHAYQLIRTRTLYMIPFLVGGFFQSIGYIARAVSATQENGEWTLGPYIVQSTLILVAPALFAASVYMHLGRVVRMVNGGQTDEKLLFGLIKTTWLTKVFVAGDVLSFMMQASGGGLMATSSVETGETLVLAGLGVQIAFFGLFVFTGVTWHLKMRSRNSVSRVSSGHGRFRSFRLLLTFLFSSRLNLFEVFPGRST